MKQESEENAAPGGKTPVPDRDIRDLLSFRLSLLANGAERLGQMHTLRQAKLRLNEWRVLALAFVLKPARFADIAAMLSMDKGQLSRIVKLLCGRGLMETRPDRNDQRAISLHLTEEGRSVHDSLYDGFEALNTKIMASLSDHERSELLRLLSLTARSIQRAEIAGI